VALRWEPNDAVTFDYAYDKSKLDENATVQALVGLNPLALNPITGERVERADALNGMIRPASTRWQARVRWQSPRPIPPSCAGWVRPGR
jgi:hypothetical protein